MSRLAWRILTEGPLEVESNFLLGHRADSKHPSHKLCCYMKLLQADHGRGGILYVYPRKSSLGHYIVFSFYNITVKEPWVATADASMDLILDFEPVQFLAADVGARDTWLAAFRGLEKMQHDHAVGRCPQGCSASKSPRISAEELQGVDMAVHHGEHLQFQSPHKDSNGEWAQSIESTGIPCDLASSEDALDSAPAAPAPPSPLTDCVILNNRQQWDLADAPARPAMLVISDLVHMIQSLYGITKEGQRLDSTDENDEDEWHVVADSQMFNHFIVATSELQVIDISDLVPHDKSKFFVSAYSLLSMHAAGVLKLTLQEVLEDCTTKKVAYIIANRVYSLYEIMELCS